MSVKCAGRVAGLTNPRSSLRPSAPAPFQLQAWHLLLSQLSPGLRPRCQSTPWHFARQRVAHPMPWSLEACLADHANSSDQQKLLQPRRPGAASLTVMLGAAYGDPLQARPQHTGLKPGGPLLADSGCNTCLTNLHCLGAELKSSRYETRKAHNQDDQAKPSLGV